MKGENTVFRIRDMDELKRMVLLLRSLDNSTVKFPVDIFRDAEEISAVQCGDSHRSAYAYTNADGRSVMEGIVHARDLLHSLRAMEEQFEKELEEEENNV